MESEPAVAKAQQSVSVVAAEKEVELKLQWGFHAHVSGRALQNDGGIDREGSAFLHFGRQAFHRSVSPGRSLPPHVSTLLIAHLKSSLGGARPKRPHWLTAYASW